MEDKIVEYRYLDKEVSLKRSEALVDFINNGDTSNLLFTDLDFLEDNKKTGYLKLRDSIKMSAIDKSIVLNDNQIEILSILNNSNLFLSAPTSFGKTFIILEHIKRNINLYNNIVFIVPTLALMNELLKTINNLFSDDFNICINAEENLTNKNFFIFVPERSGDNFAKILEERGLNIDLLIFDEFYKLEAKKPQGIAKDDRLIFLNKVYLNIVKKAKKIVLLAPYVKDVHFTVTKLDIVKYYTNFLPVHNEIHEYRENWINLIDEKPCLVFFTYPENITGSIPSIIEKVPENQRLLSRFSQEIKYLEDLYGQDWFAIDLLKRGIGVHHGRVPMFLRKFLENEYRNGEITTLLCTSTLMEGINTPTEKLIIVNAPDNEFQLNNLIGRVGRLRKTKQIIGDVYLCDKGAINLFNKKIDNWLELSILAERESIESNEERLHLEKEFLDNKKEKDFKRVISKVTELTGKKLDDIKKYDVKFTKIKKIVDEDFINKFNSCSSIYECVCTSTQLLGRDVSPYFLILHYKKLVLRPLADGKMPIVLPYNVYLEKILTGSTVKEVVCDFNNVFNINSDKINTNNFINALNDCEKYIKFKLSKLRYYFDLFNVDYSQNNQVLNNFINLLDHYNNLPVIEKIMEDLGIENKDFKTVINCIGEIKNISTSNIILQLKKNVKKISKAHVSPFTIFNIRNL